MLGNEFKMIDYRFKRNFLHEARRVTSLSLRKASPIDYATGVVAKQEGATTYSQVITS